MNRPEQISSDTFLIVITRSTSAIFLPYIAVTKIAFYEKSTRHLGNNIYFEKVA